MIIPVRCFSCNNEIGDKYELYTKLKEEVQDYGEAKKPPSDLTVLTKIYDMIKVPKQQNEANNYLSEYKTGQIKDLIGKFNKSSGKSSSKPDDNLEDLTKLIKDIDGEQKKVEFLNMLVFILLDIENYCCNRHLISHIQLIDKIN